MTGLRRRAWVVATTALALTLAACGNAEERNLCRQYEDLQASGGRGGDPGPGDSHCG